MTSSPLTPRRARTREKLLDAAVVLFASKGVLGATVEEICEQARFTRGAFYSNFADKDELCLAVLERQAARELAATEQAVLAVGINDVGGQSLEELITGALEVFLAAQPRRAADLLADLELRLYAIRNPGLRPAYLALHADVSARIGALLQNGATRIGAVLSVDVAQAIDLLHAVYAHSGSSAMLRGLEPDDASRRQELVAVLRSLVSPAPA